MTTPSGDAGQPPDPYRPPADQPTDQPTDRPADRPTDASGEQPGDSTAEQGHLPYPQPPTYGAPGYQQPGYGQPGYGYPPAGYAPGPPPTPGKATAAMIVGIVALVLACGYGIGLLGSPVALFLGRSALTEIDASQGRLGGRGMAQAGFVLGIIGTVLLVLVIIAVVVVVIVVSANGAEVLTPGGVGRG